MMRHTLYKPKTLIKGHPALVVMLHGCSQSPENFALGTQMNALAERHGFLVLYPAQSGNANPMGCWNWFTAANQSRDRGEPDLIAKLTRRIAADQDVDARRIFVAGLSAGGAMAVILSVVYADVFAAVGVHSGLPYAIAYDAASALAAMSGHPDIRKTRARPLDSHTIPTIVFHGDQDATVAASNAALIVDQAVMHLQRAGLDGQRLTAERYAGGRSCTVVTYQARDQQPLVERWLVRGLGHAWSGGSPLGSYTDRQGPDASAEMIRFFFAQPVL